MIALAVVLAVVVLLAAWIARGVLLGYPAPALRGATLTAKEQAIVGACADALFPRGGPIPVSGTEAGLVRYMDDNVRQLPSATRVLVRLLFQFVEHGPWVFGPRLARFTLLSPTERVAALRDMQTSSIYFRRIAFLSIRTMLSMGYLANDAVARAIGMRRAPAGEAA